MDRNVAGGTKGARALIDRVQRWARREPQPGPLASIVADFYPYGKTAIWSDVVRVLEFGAKKYAPFNWEKGIEYSRVYHAFCRHWKAILVDGELNDPETGLPHEAHALCELMFLVVFEARGLTQFDDRPGTPQQIADTAADLWNAMQHKPSEPPRLFLWTRGGKILYLEPRTVEELPTIETIAESLSNQSRWTGHAGKSYTIADHSIAVSKVRQKMAQADGGAGVHNALYALLHDAHECVLGDVNSRVKAALKAAGCTELKRLADNFDRLLWARECLQGVAPRCEAEISRADKAVGQAEAELLKIAVPHEQAQEYCGTDPMLLDLARTAVQSQMMRIMPVDLAFVLRYQELKGQIDGW
jgi:5'-deoxynucleotidase YfbR-like HD superfamily hydrolase